MVKATNILAVLALGILPLALTVGCQRQSKEEIIAEFQAQQAEQDRVAKLEAELAEMREQQAADNSAAQEQQAEQIKALEKQVAAQKAKAEQAAKEAAAAQQQQQGRRRGGGEAAGGEGQQTARSSVISVPQGTQVAVSLSADLTTDSHKTGDYWEGKLAQDVMVGNDAIWKAGARVGGIVSASTPAGRLANGEGTLAIKLTEVGGAAIDGGIYAVTGDAKGGRNAAVIGSTTALGALAGILSSKSNKGDHALGGAAIGAAVGTALAAGTGTTVIKIPAASTITFKLPADERVVVRGK